MATISIKLNKTFKAVNQSKCRYIVMLGSAGSGKSVDTAMNYILRLMAQKGRNLLCIRKSEVTHRHSTYSELNAAINKLGVSHLWRVTSSPLQLTCMNGNSVIFRGINDEKQREKLKSITFAHGKLTDVWIEEATELQQSDFEIIDDRLRGELSSGLFYQIKLTFNPVNKNHWIKKVFFDKPDNNVLTHKSTYRENRFIDQAYFDRMERRREVDPEGYRIYGLGEWGEIGGLIIKKYEVKELSQNEEDYDRVVLSQDFGFNHANALLMVGFKDGNLYVLKELYLYGKDTSEIIQLAQDFPKDKVMWCDSAEPDRIQMWKTAGFQAKPVHKSPGSVNAQIDYLKQHKIVVDPSCVNTIKELDQWKYRIDEKTGEYTEQPVEFFDDAMAALRYSIEELRNPRPKIKLSERSIF